MADEQQIVLSNTLVQALGDYLITRPYREVAGLIAALQQEVQASARLNGSHNPDPERRVSEVPGDLQ